jgi:hypothetical protein
MINCTHKHKNKEYLKIKYIKLKVKLYKAINLKKYAKNV